MSIESDATVRLRTERRIEGIHDELQALTANRYGLTRREIIDQFPPEHQLPPPIAVEDDAYDFDVNNEAMIQRLYGAAVEQLTLPLAQQMAPLLPITFHVLFGQNWWGASDRPAIRAARIETLTFLHWDQSNLKMIVLHIRDGYADFEELTEHDGRMNSNGLDPVYLFVRRGDHQHNHDLQS